VLLSEKISAMQTLTLLFDARKIRPANGDMGLTGHLLLAPTVVVGIPPQDSVYGFRQSYRIPHIGATRHYASEMDAS
jgi:hypothetical protein